MFKIQHGFGPIDEGIDKCWDVKESPHIHLSETAQQVADYLYESNVKDLMTTQPDWWQSYWVRVVTA